MLGNGCLGVRITADSRYKLISPVRCMLGRYPHHFLESFGREWEKEFLSLAQHSHSQLRKVPVMRYKLAASPERGAYNENII